MCLGAASSICLSPFSVESSRLDSLRCRGQRNGVHVDKLPLLDHAVRGGPEALEMRRLNVRLARICIAIDFKDCDVGRILVLGHRIQDEIPGLFANERSLSSTPSFRQSGANPTDPTLIECFRLCTRRRRHAVDARRKQGLQVTGHAATHEPALHAVRGLEPFADGQDRRQAAVGSSVASIALSLRDIAQFLEELRDSATRPCIQREPQKCPGELAYPGMTRPVRMASRRLAAPMTVAVGISRTLVTERPLVDGSMDPAMSRRDCLTARARSPDVPSLRRRDCGRSRR
jgi:hypothetical protein